MKNNEKEKQPHKSNELKQVKPKSSIDLKSYARYSGVAIQLGVTIAIGAFIGRKVDEWMGFDKPLMTALFSLLATIMGIYLLVRDLVQK